MAFKGATSSQIDLTTIIKSAADSEASSHHSTILIGSPGGGKSFTSSTCPLSDKVLHLDFDGKLAHIKKLAPPNVDIASLMVTPETSSEVDLALDVILDNQEEGVFTYDWVFIDSLTSLFSLYTYRAHSTLGGSQYRLNFDKQDYVKDKVWRLLFRCFGLFKNTVLICHETARENVEGNTIILPAAVKELSEKLPGRFQNIFHSTIRGSGDKIAYVWETHPDGIYACTSQILNIPHIVPNHWDFILTTNWEEFGDKSITTAVEAYEKSSGRKLTKWNFTTLK